LPNAITPQKASARLNCNILTATDDFSELDQWIHGSFFLFHAPLGFCPQAPEEAKNLGGA
jgi:hypothetical protein